MNPTPSPSPPSEQGTRDQLETLARWMGWKVERSPDGGQSTWVQMDAGGHGCFLYLQGKFVPGWNPFADANAAEQVWERAHSLGWMIGVAVARAFIRGKYVSNITTPDGMPYTAYGTTPKGAVTLAVLAVIAPGEEEPPPV